MSALPDILQKILARKFEEIQQRSTELSLRELSRKVEAAPPVRSFYDALESQIKANRAAVIAEIKKASPSKGVLRENFIPEDIARSYARGGAACLSVLTDRDFFQGKEAYLTLARQASGLPVLRKDFIVDPYQVYGIMGRGLACAIALLAQ